MREPGSKRPKCEQAGHEGRIQYARGSRPIKTEQFFNRHSHTTVGRQTRHTAAITDTPGPSRQQGGNRESNRTVGVAVRTNAVTGGTGRGNPSAWHHPPRTPASPLVGTEGYARMSSVLPSHTPDLPPRFGDPVDDGRSQSRLLHEPDAVIFSWFSSSATRHNTIAEFLSFGAIRCNQFAPLKLYPSGNLSECVIAEPESVGGVPCNQFGPLALYETGQLAMCVLSRQHRIDGVTCVALSRITLRPDGSLSACGAQSGPPAVGCRSQPIQTMLTASTSLRRWATPTCGPRWATPIWYARTCGVWSSPWEGRGKIRPERTRRGATWWGRPAPDRRGATMTCNTMRRDAKGRETAKPRFVGSIPTGASQLRARPPRSARCAHRPRPSAPPAPDPRPDSTPCAPLTPTRVGCGARRLVATGRE